MCLPARVLAITGVDITEVELSCECFTLPWPAAGQAAMLDRDPLIVMSSDHRRTGGSVLVIYNPCACIVGVWGTSATETGKWAYIGANSLSLTSLSCAIAQIHQLSYHQPYKSKNVEAAHQGGED